MLYYFQRTAVTQRAKQSQRESVSRVEDASYLATRWTASRSRRAGCIYEGASLEEASVIGIDVPRRRFASSREHERVLTAAGLASSAVRRESEGTCWSLGRRWRDDQTSRKRDRLSTNLDVRNLSG